MTKLSDFIGALEIGNAHLGPDAASEHVLAGPTPTMPRRIPGGTCIADGALEEAAFSGPTTTRPRQFGGTCVDDAAFEAAEA
jgi:hypothetical protein